MSFETLSTIGLMLIRISISYGSDEIQMFLYDCLPLANVYEMKYYYAKFVSRILENYSTWQPASYMANITVKSGYEV